MNYYIADTHFGHRNIINFDCRPFHDITEMKLALIARWNKRVTSEDTVFILGDFCWGKAPEWIELLSALNGNKVLIRGNHDLRNMPAELRHMFADVKDYKEIKDGDRLVIMCHYPIPCYKKDYDPNVYMLHGHVHETQEWAHTHTIVSFMKESNPGKYQGNVYNVGAMMDYMDYTPRILDEIIAGGSKYY